MKLLIKLTFLFVVASCIAQEPDVHSFSQQKIDSLNAVIFDLNETISNTQVIDISDSANVGPYHLIRLPFENDTLYAYTLRNHAIMVSELSKMPAVQQWNINGADIEIILNNNKVSLSVYRGDTCKLLIDGFDFGLE